MNTCCGGLEPAGAILQIAAPLVLDGDRLAALPVKTGAIASRTTLDMP